MWEAQDAVASSKTRRLLSQSLAALMVVQETMEGTLQKTMVQASTNNSLAERDQHLAAWVVLPSTAVAVWE